MSQEINDLEARKQELFATITLLAGVKRDILAARGQRRTDLIERQAQLEADKERLSHEVNSQYMYRNLQAFMNRVDEYDGARKREAEETHSGLAALSGQFREMAEDVTQLKKDMVDSQEDRQRIHNEVAALRDRLEDYIERLEEYIAGSRRGEVDEMKAQLDDLTAERARFTPEERASLTDTLLRMIAEYRATHGDGQ